MTADTENLVLEHLRHIRARVDHIAEDMTDLKLRMSGLENAMVLVKREITHGDETDARQQTALDRLTSELFEWLEQLARDASLTRLPAYHDRITGDVLTVGDAV